MDELDFPHSLYEAVMAVPPESVSMLAPAEFKRFYLEGMSPSTQDEVDAAGARELGITVLEYLQRKAAASGSVAYDPGLPQKEPSAPGTRTSDAGQRKAESVTPGAGRGAVGSPRGAF